MSSSILELTLRGSVLFLLVWILDSLLSRRMHASWRHLWWLSIPLAFLLPWQISLPISAPAWTDPLPIHQTIPADIPTTTSSTHLPQFFPSPGNALPILGILWLLGVAITGIVLLRNTVASLRAWKKASFSQDSRLISILEKCRLQAGISAPIGLIISNRITQPVILGWLRPRILLPASSSSSWSREKLRHVFLHELAHFRSWDVPLNWLFALACCFHWFNPLAWLAASRWRKFRETSADEAVLRWDASSTAETYGETLLTLASVGHTSPPFGSVAISESFLNLKHRILMLKSYPHKSSHPLTCILATCLLLTLVLFQPIQGSETDEDAEKTTAVTAMESWLHGIDQGEYASSWKSASTDFRKAISESGWENALNGVRKPLGKLLSRQLVSAVYQREIPNPDGTMRPVNYVIAQFDTSFENMKSSLETVTFELQDGTWKAAGYFIRPR